MKTYKQLNPPKWELTSGIGKSIDGYVIGPLQEHFLGFGRTCECYLACHRKTGKWRALKLLKNAYRINDRLDRLDQEILMLEKLNGHRNVVHLYDYKRVATLTEGDRQRTQPYMALEYCKVKLESCIRYGLDENLARSLFHQIIDGLEWCHNRCEIAHRDLKPNNIMLNEAGVVKLIDFGFSSVYQERPMQTQVGTRAYMAPEVWQGNYTKAADIWSAGTTLFVMVHGHCVMNEARGSDPFFKKLKDRDYAGFWRNGDADFFSRDLKELLEGMLCVDVDQRFTIDQIRSTDWYKGEVYTPEEAAQILGKKKKEWKRKGKRGGDTAARFGVVPCGWTGGHSIK